MSKTPGSLILTGSAGIFSWRYDTEKWLCANGVHSWSAVSSRHPKKQFDVKSFCSPHTVNAVQLMAVTSTRRVSSGHL